MTKEELLRTGHFIDNSYLDDYIKLVNSTSTVRYTERHHILPRAYFDLLEIATDNSDANLVRLSFADHCKAHWLLYFCTTDKLQYASQTAFVIMVNGLAKRLKDYTEEDFIAIQEMKDQLLADSNTFWSAKDDEFLKNNFLSFSDEELANKLNRTEIAIQARRTYLQLPRVNMTDFTAEEIEYIVANFKVKSSAEIASDLGRSVGSIRQKCHRLGLKKKAASWSDSELAFLRANAMSMSLTDLSHHLGRSKAAIKRQCHVHQIKCKRTDLWTESELTFLKEHCTTMTAKQLSEALNRSVGAIEHKCQASRLLKSTKY